MSWNTSVHPVEPINHSSLKCSGLLADTTNPLRLMCQSLYVIRFRRDVLDVSEVLSLCRSATSPNWLDTMLTENVSLLLLVVMSDKLNQSEQNRIW